MEQPLPAQAVLSTQLSKILPPSPSCVQPQEHLLPTDPGHMVRLLSLPLQAENVVTNSPRVPRPGSPRRRAFPW